MSPAQPGEDARAASVRQTFDRIATRYDRLNRLISLGQDRRWRRELIAGLGLPTGARLLDIGTGTGDLALEARRRDPSLRIVGCDLSAEMLAVRASELLAAGVRLVRADAERLPFPKECFGGAVSAFLLRNLGDMQRGIAEQLRVLEPGGVMACLESAPPSGGILQALVRFYLMRLIPLAGRWLAGDQAAYRYLARSTLAFLGPAQLSRVLSSHGLQRIRSRLRMWGAINLHWGIKA